MTYQIASIAFPKNVVEYLQEINPRYTAETYSLLTRNCNNFSNEVAQFLVGTGIPEYILQLPNEVLSSPMGAMILPMIQNLDSTLRAGAVPQVPQFNPAAASIPIASISLNRTSASALISATKSSPEPDTNGVKPGQSAAANVTNAVPPAVQPRTKEKPSSNGPTEDSLGDARSKIQGEITSEFAALMDGETMSASEAASLAARKVMQKYGHM